MEIPYTQHEITPDDITAVTDVLTSSYLTGGPDVNAFESNFSDYVSSSEAVAVSSGTAALHLAVEALGVRPGQKILMPSLTFAADANAALYSGAVIEFVDINPKTLLVDIPSVEERLSSDPDRYAGVIGVDFAGYPIDSRRISNICRRYGAWFLEDAAHALGAVANYRGESVPVGSNRYSDVTAFSFHPAKHITTGEGGMITTQFPSMVPIIRQMRSHSMNRGNPRSQTEGWYYQIDSLGYNYRMSDINAALGASQLKRMPQNIARRQVIAEKYREFFKGTAIKLPEYHPAQIHANHLFVVQVDNRRQVYDKLKENGIFSQVHYVPLHTQPFYKRMQTSSELPNTEQYYERCLSIPMFPGLKEEEQDFVIRTLIKYAG